MKLIWIGHSCFKIEVNGISIVIDPYSDGSVPGLENVSETANLVYSSHEHKDHDAVENVELIKLPENTSTIIDVMGIETYHDEAKGAKRGLNTVKILKIGDTKIAHFGDLGSELEPSEKKLLKDLDLALIPVGGFYTIDGKQAAEIIKEIAPRVTVPMHFRNDRYGFGFDEISTVDPFVEEFKNVNFVNKSEINISKETEGVYVMVPQNILRNY